MFNDILRTNINDESSNIDFNYYIENNFHNYLISES